MSRLEYLRNTPKVRVVIRVRWPRPLRTMKRPPLVILWLVLASLYPMRIAPNLLAGIPDTRPAKLEKFFKSYQCPAPYYIDDYLRAADAHAIDYRLLPAVSVRETTCGQYDSGTNRWGWDSARTQFESVESGIDFIADRLAAGGYYQGKSIEQKLFTYNPSTRYVTEVKQLMREIDEDGL
jgi:hypothetical protein